jgi:7-dehydrocholesterol reductase
MAKWERTGANFLLDFVVPFLLMATTPFVPFIFFQMFLFHDGSILSFVHAVQDNPFLFYERLPSPSVLGLKILSAFIFFEYCLYRLLPGAKYLGPLTEQGFRPRYVENAVSSFFISHLLMGYLLYTRIVPGEMIYDELPAIFAILVPGVFAFVVYLYLSAKPGGEDVYFSNSFVWDLWKGVQLHPRAFGIDLKQFINCRVAMMAWGLILLVFCAKQHHMHGSVSTSLLVSVTLQLIYIYKFFLWEAGYMYSIDIIHDRAGFMIIWGIMNWLPVVYTCHSHYLIYRTAPVPLEWNIFVFLLGLFAVYYNYDVDAQRKLARDTDGKCAIWDDNPCKVMRVTYKAGDKEHRTFLLLSGWWGWSRHANYLFELILALSWGLPAYEVAFAPYFYFVFLTTLLVHRAKRDDDRCEGKYGQAWNDYKKLVPYSIIKYIY